MTRNEAIAQLNKRFPYDYDKHENIIDFYIEMGMLTVEAEKTANEKAIEVLNNKGYGTSAYHVINHLEAAGLKIVDTKK